jgi:uncharacterized membrane protein YdbT with pleckstrin-like domain
MRYINNNLLSDEKIVYETCLNGIVFVWPVIWLLLFVVTLFSSDNYETLGGILFYVFIISLISSIIAYNQSEFGVTNKRVILKTGLFRIKSLEILLTKIESISVNQSFLGRALGYGNITITGTGGVRNIYKRINNPLLFRKNIHEQIETFKDKANYL